MDDKDIVYQWYQGGFPLEGCNKDGLFVLAPLSTVDLLSYSAVATWPTAVSPQACEVNIGACAAHACTHTLCRVGGPLGRMCTGGSLTVAKPG